MATAIDNEVLDAFLIEAGEMLDALAGQLLALEAQPLDDELLNAVFRTFHTVKGGAGFLGVRPMVELCHDAEELLNDARNQRVVLEPDHIDALLQVSDVVVEMIQALRDGIEVAPAPAELMARLQAQAPVDPAAAAHAPSPAEAPGPGGDAIDDSEFEALLDSIYGAGGAPGVGEGGAPAAGGDGSNIGENPPLDVIPATWRAGARPNSEAGPKGERQDGASKAGIHVDSGSDGKLDPGSREARFIPSLSKGLDDEQACEPAEAAPRAPVEPHKHRADNSVRVDTQRIDALVNAAGELVLVRNRMLNLTASGASGEVQRTVTHLDRVVGDLQAAALRMRMQPVGQLFQRFPRIVRDLARKLGKQVALQQRGEDTNLDRMMVESLADPLIHLLRNAVDHGLEEPEARTQAGKPAQGTVTLSAGQQGERVVISIRDDGRGMDPEVLRRKAVEKGLIGAEEASLLVPAECLKLIFRPGFSTRSEISDVSGRGVGMDVVKTSVAALGGTLDIESEPGTGTTIRIGIPLTLAILRVLMVRAGDRRLALSMANVVEVFELDHTQMRALDGRTIAARGGRPLPLVDLAAWTGVPLAVGARMHVVVVDIGHQQLGIVTTEVMGREEIMVKPLGSHLQHLPGIAGATITGDGRIALVLDLVALAESSVPTPLRMTA